MQTSLLSWEASRIPLPTLDELRPSKKFVDRKLPHWKILQRLRFAGCPYENCKKYTIVYRILDDGAVGNVLASWIGDSLDCPTSFWWDEQIPWCWFTTDFLTTTSSSSQTFSVPVDWNNASNKAEAIGGGGSGACSINTPTTNDGSGAGAYATISNITLTAGGTAPFTIGLAATGSTGAKGNIGTDTNFNSGILIAKAGHGTTGNGVGAGGLASACTPSSGAFNGGSGGADNATSGKSAAGGGGSGSPNGAGLAGGALSGVTTLGGATGGGGAGAVSATAGVAITTSQTGGSAGGTAQDGTAGGTAGTGGTTPTAGGAGSHGSGGGGSGSGTSAGGAVGGVGGNGVEWDASHGAGGGGGASGAAVTSVSRAGNGGKYGGGGGCAGFGTTAAAGGDGGQGIIVLTYTPVINVTFDNPTPYENSSTPKKDSITATDAGSALNCDKIILDQYQWSLFLSNNILEDQSSSPNILWISPFDGEQLLRSDAVFQIDYAHIKNTDLIFPEENEAIVQLTNIIPFEHGGITILILDNKLFIDWRSAFNFDSVTPQEISISVLKDISFRFEQNGSTKIDVSIPDFYLSTFTAGEPIFSEFSSDLRNNFPMQDDYDLSVIYNTKVFMEVETSLSLSSSNPIFYSVNIFSDQKNPTEYLSKLFFDNIIFLDNLSPVKKDTSFNVDSEISLRSDTTMKSDYELSVFLALVSAPDQAGGVKNDGLFPVNYLHNFVASVTVPLDMEIRFVIDSLSDFQIEYNARFMADCVLPTEWPTLSYNENPRRLLQKRYN